MTNRLLALLTAIAFACLGGATAHTMTASPCPSGWVQVQGPALCELDGSN